LPISPYFAAFGAVPAPILPAIAAKSSSSRGVDSAAPSKEQAMIRSTGAAGFSGSAAPVASTRLNDAVAASLAIASLSLCLIVALTLFSIKVSMAMPVPA
jgi:hypothetical protein